MRQLDEIMKEIYAFMIFPALFKKILPSAAAPRNIPRGFKISAIFPFDTTVFADKKLMPIFVTDHPVYNGITIEDSKPITSALTTGNFISQFPNEYFNAFLTLETSGENKLLPSGITDLPQ